MLRNLIFASILIGTVCAIHLQYLMVDSAEEDYNESLGAAGEDEALPMPKAQLPGLCWACKWAMKNIKKQLNNNNIDNIRNKLKNVCNKIGLLKNQCTKLVNKNIDILTEELSTSDDPETICKNIRICKSKSMTEFINDFPRVQQNI